jgi:hypothetical protein
MTSFKIIEIIMKIKEFNNWIFKNKAIETSNYNFKNKTIE